MNNVHDLRNDEESRPVRPREFRGASIATPDGVRRVKNYDGNSFDLLIDPSSIPANAFDSSSWQDLLLAAFSGEQIDQTAAGLERHVDNVLATILMWAKAEHRSEGRLFFIRGMDRQSRPSELAKRTTQILAPFFDTSQSVSR